MLRDLAQGVADFGRGCQFWRQRPGLMALGVLPALVVLVVFAVLLTGVVGVADDVAAWLTPFTGAWDASVRTALRAAVTAAIVVGSVAVAVLAYTAVTLAVGTPVYDHVSRAVEDAHGGVPDEVVRPLRQQVVRAVADAIRMLVSAACLGLVVAVVGLIPLVGAPVAVVVAAVGGGLTLATELTGTACDARGLTLGERRLLLRRHRWRSLGFGLTCYLVFLVPGGAVLLTPAAVAGGTLLARDLVPQSSDQRGSGDRRYQ